MIRVSVLREKMKQVLDTREEKSKPLIGKIVSVNGSVNPEFRPNYVWISEYNQPESRIPVFNDAVVPVEGLYVWVVETPKPPFRLQVYKVYTGGLPENHPGHVGGFGVPIHGTNHQMPTEATAGPDPVLIFQPALQSLKTTGDGLSLTVTIRPYTYHTNGSPGTFGGATLDLTSYVPGVGLVRRVLIYLDISTNSVGVVSGLTVADTGIPVPYPSIPSGTVPSAYVTLANGQTSVTTATQVVDARDFLGAYSVAGEPYLATEEGQVLFSTNGVTYEPRLPLVNRWGWMQNDQGLLLVI